MDRLGEALFAQCEPIQLKSVAAPLSRLSTPKAVHGRLTVENKMAGSMFHLKGPAHPSDGSAVQQGAGCSGRECFLDTLQLLPAPNASEQARAA